MLTFTFTHIISRVVFFVIVLYLNKAIDRQIVQEVSYAIGISGLFRYIINFAGGAYYLAHPSAQNAIGTIKLNLRIVAIVFLAIIAFFAIQSSFLFAVPLVVSFAIGANLALVDFLYLLKTLCKQYSRIYIYSFHTFTYLSVIVLLAPGNESIALYTFLTISAVIPIYVLFILNRVETEQPSLIIDIFDIERLKLFVSSLPEALLIPVTTILLIRSGQVETVPVMLQAFAVAGLMCYPFTIIFLFYSRENMAIISAVFNHPAAPVGVVISGVIFSLIFFFFLSIVMSLYPELVPEKISWRAVASVQAACTFILQWITFFLRMNNHTMILVITGWVLLPLGALTFIAVRDVTLISYFLNMGRTILLAVYLYSRR